MFWNNNKYNPCRLNNIRKITPLRHIQTYIHIYIYKILYKKKYIYIATDKHKNVNKGYF